jgi:beta-glucanase (GH16 family)
MKYLYIIILFLFSLNSFSQFQLVWSDEFDGDTLDNTKWNYEIGNGTNGWGNNEKEYYTSRPQNIKVQDGKLIITAINESYGGFGYTSGRITTKGKGHWKYGRFEIGAKLPHGTGIWPAFWLMPEAKSYGTGMWPDNGEVDIMEYVGYDPGKIYGTVHVKNHYGSNGVGKSLNYSGVENSQHVFAVEWGPDTISWYVDNYKYFTYLRNGNSWEDWPFDKDFYIILNLAVGGNWGGAKGIDNSIFPQTFEIDYVRIYQMHGLEINKSTSGDLIKVSPNPVKDKIRIYLDDNIVNRTRATVYDSSGIMVFPPSICKSNITEIDFSTFKPGAYLVVVQNSKGSQSFKLIKI